MVLSGPLNLFFYVYDLLTTTTLDFYEQNLFVRSVIPDENPSRYFDDLYRTPSRPRSEAPLSRPPYEVPSSLCEKSSRLLVKISEEFRVDERVSLNRVSTYSGLNLSVTFASEYLRNCRSKQGFSWSRRTDRSFNLLGSYSHPFFLIQRPSKFQVIYDYMKVITVYFNKDFHTT